MEGMNLCQIVQPEKVPSLIKQTEMTAIVVVLVISIFS